jgi:hypothetical protein
MPTAIEKQINEEQGKAPLQAEEMEGEYRPSQTAKWDISARSIRYVLSISVLLITAAYVAVDRWEQIQGLFQSPAEVPSLLEPEVDLADPGPQALIPLEPLAGNPLSGQIKRQAQPEKPVQPAEVNPVIAALPALGESDDLYRDQWAELWSNKQLLSWTETEQLARKATALIDNLAQGKIVRNLLGVFKPESPFMVDLLLPASVEEGSVDIYRLDPASYQRYTPLVNSIVGADTDQLLAFYVRMRPLFQAAYLELGYPGGHIDGVFLKTLRNIQVVPVLEGEVRLVRPKVMYQFQDQKLEQRSALDKQMFRLGPENMRALQQKAKELEVAMSAVLH